MPPAKKRRIVKQSPLHKNLLPLAILIVLTLIALLSGLISNERRTVTTKASENTVCKKTLRKCLLGCMKEFPTSLSDQEECAIPCKENFTACDEGALSARTLRVSADNLPCPEKCAFENKGCFATCKMCDGEPNNMCGCRGKTDKKKCEQSCRKEKKECLSVCPVNTTITPSPSATPAP